MRGLVVCALLLVAAGLGTAGKGKGEKSLSRQKRQVITNNCRGGVVTTYEDSGELRPSHYPYGYRRGYCRWQIIADANEVINFDIDRIESLCPRGEYLWITDGNGEELLKECGSLTPEPVTSFTNEVTVVFRGRRRNRRRVGFYLTFQTSGGGGGGGEEEENDPCSPTGELIEEASGTRTSEGFEEDGLGQYNDNSDCKWIIQTPNENDNLLLTFDRFSVESHSQCNYDWLDIRDGADASAPGIARYCGSGSVPEIKSMGNTLYLHFMSDGSVTDNGFKFNWETLVAGTPNDGSEPGCGDLPNRVEATSGEITSPNYGSDYPSDSECAHVISTSPGTMVQITLEELDIELGADCVFDSLTIFDGPDPTSPLLYGSSICGTSIPTIPTSTSNQVYIVFESDSTRQAAGFRLSWEEMEPSEVLNPPCTGNGQFITGETSGSIMSDGFDGSGYEDNMDCRWRIQAPEGGQIVITWNTIDIEDHDSCGYDALKVYDGPNADDKLIETYCGDLQNAEPIKTTGNNVYVRFTTDESVTRVGFSASFLVLAPDTTDDGSADGCDGSPAQPAASFTSPGYDGSTTYAAQASCAWQLSASADKHIQITFSNVDVEEMPACSADAIKIHGGPLATSPIVKIICGTPGDDIIVIVRSNEAYVTFTSDATLAGTGFQATWEEVEPVAAQCGVSNPSFPINPKFMKSPKIVGGEEANPNSIPWQILLKHSGSFACGGSVISENWVVTAAHCLTSMSRMTIEAGLHDRGNIDSKVQTRTIKTVIGHPNYANYDSDIALLELSSPLQLNEYVQPICIAEADVAPGTDCLISGWGQTGNGNTASRLQQVYVPVTSQSVCRESNGASVTDNMLCAGLPQGGIDTCSGDSGGPLVCPSAAGDAWVLHGITSWGYGCAEPNKPGVYVRVSNFKEWIQQHTGGAGFVVA